MGVLFLKMKGGEGFLEGWVGVTTLSSFPSSFPSFAEGFFASLSANALALSFIIDGPKMSL